MVWCDWYACLFRYNRCIDLTISSSFFFFIVFLLLCSFHHHQFFFSLLSFILSFLFFYLFLVSSWVIFLSLSVIHSLYVELCACHVCTPSLCIDHDQWKRCSPSQRSFISRTVFFSLFLSRSLPSNYAMLPSPPLQKPWHVRDYRDDDRRLARLPSTPRLIPTKLWNSEKSYPCMR